MAEIISQRIFSMATLSRSHWRIRPWRARAPSNSSNPKTNSFSTGHGSQRMGTRPFTDEDPRSRAQNVQPVPTLFQFLTEAYEPLNLRELLKPPDSKLRPPGGRRNLNWFLRIAPEHYDTLRTAFLDKDEPKAQKPTRSEIRSSLAAAARSQSFLRTQLPHPDFSSVAIRRMKEDGGEEVIHVPIGEYLNACNADTPEAECRAKDVELRPGDIIELKARYERAAEAWERIQRERGTLFREGSLLRSSVSACRPRTKSK